MSLNVTRTALLCSFGLVSFISFYFNLSQFKSEERNIAVGGPARPARPARSACPVHLTRGGPDGRCKQLGHLEHLPDFGACYLSDKLYAAKTFHPNNLAFLFFRCDSRGALYEEVDSLGGRGGDTVDLAG